MAKCPFCYSPFSSPADVRRHQNQVRACRLGVLKQFGAAIQRVKKVPAAENEGTEAPKVTVPAPRSAEDSSHAYKSLPMDIDPVEASLEDDSNSDQPEEVDNDAIAPRIEEVHDHETRPKTNVRVPFPEAMQAGMAFGAGKTAFEEILDEEVLKGAEVWGPFADEEEWQLAKWLIKNVGHTQADNFLKLPIITNRTKPSFANKQQFLDRIDSLPEGVCWQCEDLEVQGNLPDLERDSSGKTMRKEKLELWHRDPVELVAELIGNPAFRDVMKYAPERVYEDSKKDNEVINEMWTGKWWWDIQSRLPKGATVAPVILSSDKTMLSNFRGDNSAWPVYLTIGNIGKETRREVTAHATVLAGYLPIPKFDCFDDRTRSLAKYRLFHDCMTRLLEPLVSAGQTGKTMVCADGLLRKIWPIFAVYVADYPEQCLVACCKENCCPICTVDPNERGSHTTEAKRDVKETLFYIARQQDGHKDTVFEAQGIRAVDQPFWRMLPHSDIFASFTPDLLHQLHKGVFKDHVVKWCTEIISKAEVDARFRSLPSHPGLRHFKNGISHVSQWTGTVHKEMEKVFLGLVASHQDPRLVAAVRSLIDFIYLASLQSHTTQTLLALRQTLTNFHLHKQVFIELGGRNSLHFNIPKLHALEHYADLIWLFGSADGFNTESPERLHIDFAKNAYRASNRKDYLEQMTRWLERQENVDRFSSYLSWRETRGGNQSGMAPEPNSEPEELPAAVYTMAKRPPAASRNVLASYIISPQGYSATRFLPALSAFFRARGVQFTPKDFDVFGLWKQITFSLPDIPQVGKRHLKHIVRACGPVASDAGGTGRRRPEQPAHLDFAFVRTAEANKFTDGSPLHGLRIAQVCAIFQLPKQYPAAVQQAQPLAYIEWFTPLREPDPLTGYHHISRSSRRKGGIDGPYAEIVTVDRIVRNAMLIPKTRLNTKQYYLNSHIDGHLFCTIKLGLHGCLPGNK